MSLKHNTLSNIRGPNGPRVYVETGSYIGDSIGRAIAAGFKEIHSIELSEKFYTHCCKRFRRKLGVHIHHGASEKVLPKIVAKIKEPAIIFLDSHWSKGGTAKGDNPVPLLLELEALARMPVKKHTIMIDDIRLFGSDDADGIWKEITSDKVIEAVKKINPEYLISYADGYKPKDILIARYPKWIGV
jgi:hypothetical protein